MTGEELNAAIYHKHLPLDGEVHLHLLGDMSVAGVVQAFVRNPPEPAPLGIVMGIEGKGQLYVPRSSIIAIESVIAAE